MQLLPEPISFMWDQGNKEKNLLKHQLPNNEIEECFFDSNKKMLKDVLHSQQEVRYILLGKNLQNNLLYIAFTIRNNLIRVISARPLNKSERRLYEK